MIQNQSSDNQFHRSISIAFTVIAITLIYASTLLRKDASIIIGITFVLYGILKLSHQMCSGASIEKLDRIIFYAFILLSLIPLAWGFWQALIHTNIISR